MVGKSKQAILDFIDDIPDEKIEGFPDYEKKLWKNENCHIDVQCVTKNDEWNLQIQVKARPRVTTLRFAALQTVAGPVMVPRTAPMTPEEIKQAFREKIYAKAPYLGRGTDGAVALKGRWMVLEEGMADNESWVPYPRRP